MPATPPGWLPARQARIGYRGRPLAGNKTGYAGPLIGGVNPGLKQTATSTPGPATSYWDRLRARLQGILTQGVRYYPPGFAGYGQVLANQRAWGTGGSSMFGLPRFGLPGPRYDDERASESRYVTPVKTGGWTPTISRQASNYRRSQTYKFAPAGQQPNLPVQPQQPPAGGYGLGYGGYPYSGYGYGGGGGGGYTPKVYTEYPQAFEGNVPAMGYQPPTMPRSQFVRQEYVPNWLQRLTQWQI